MQQTQEEENISIRDFEYHRKNLKSKKGLISKIEPLNKKEVKIEYKLHYGESVGSEVITTDEISSLLESVGLDADSSIKELENKDIDLNYTNDNWEINKDWVENVETEEYRYKSIHSSSKMAHLFGTLFAFILYTNIIFSIVNASYMLDTLLLGLCAVIIHITTGFLLQHTSYIVVEKNLKKYGDLAPVSRKAYKASTKSILMRIFHAVTFHL